MIQLETERYIICNLTDLELSEFETTLNKMQHSCMGSAKGFLD